MQFGLLLFYFRCFRQQPLFQGKHHPSSEIEFSVPLLYKHYIFVVKKFKVGGGGLEILYNIFRRGLMYTRFKQPVVVEVFLKLGFRCTRRLVVRILWPIIRLLSLAHSCMYSMIHFKLTRNSQIALNPSPAIFIQQSIEPFI